MNSTDYTNSTFDAAMRRRFGGKVYRLSLSSGCTCPNRDGKISTGGCIFCSAGGSGEFAAPASMPVREQIERAKKAVQSKLSKSFAGYVAYFQSYTNTYGNADELFKRYYEAISHPEVLALSIATRPDCLSDDIMKMLLALRAIKPVWVELGLQTVHENTAQFINRGYSLDVYDEAVRKLKSAGIEVITHIIIGLPGETDEMIADTVEYVSRPFYPDRSDSQICASVQHTPLHIDGIKLQLLHVLKCTKLGDMYISDPDVIPHYTLDEYARLIVRLIGIIPPEITVHRLTGDAPKKLLIYPEWSADKKRVLNTLNSALKDF